MKTHAFFLVGVGCFGLVACAAPVGGDELDAAECGGKCDSHALDADEVVPLQPLLATCQLDAEAREVRCRHEFNTSLNINDYRGLRLEGTILTVGGRGKNLLHHPNPVTFDLDALDVDITSPIEVELETEVWMSAQGRAEAQAFDADREAQWHRVARGVSRAELASDAPAELQLGGELWRVYVHRRDDDPEDITVRVFYDDVPDREDGLANRTKILREIPPTDDPALFHVFSDGTVIDLAVLTVSWGWNRNPDSIYDEGVIDEEYGRRLRLGGPGHYVVEGMNIEPLSGPRSGQAGSHEYYGP